jgi:hypothetical protein
MIMIVLMSVRFGMGGSVACFCAGWEPRDPAFSRPANSVPMDSFSGLA